MWARVMNSENCKRDRLYESHFVFRSDVDGKRRPRCRDCLTTQWCWRDLVVRDRDKTKTFGFLFETKPRPSTFPRDQDVHVHVRNEIETFSRHSFWYVLPICDSVCWLKPRPPCELSNISVLHMKIITLEKFDRYSVIWRSTNSTVTYIIMKTFVWLRILNW